MPFSFDTVRSVHRSYDVYIFVNTWSSCQLYIDLQSKMELIRFIFTTIHVKLNHSFQL